ncbi:MAG: glycosyl transferase family 2 [Flammeovirgaceae bacterium]|nr:glycosyl transferase family 2 [Flammeovirgaceae bacterium]
MPKYSLIVPVFKREDEVLELIASLNNQSYRSYELILVDGSPTNDLKSVDDHAALKFPLMSYYRLYRKGLGISASRNLGATHATGEYLIFMDSDILVPPSYFQKIDKVLNDTGPDCFGGPDAAHETFSTVQKAISFSMTSFFTTGGIRGKKTHVGKFKPRGFNYGIRKSVFQQLNGFNENLPVGEDMDLSARVISAGYRTMLIPEAFLYHKRRVSIKKFYKQVFRFGAARILLSKLHSGEMKLPHLFPLVFSLYLISGLVLPFISFLTFKIWSGSLLVYCSLIFAASTFENRSLLVGLVSVATSITQFLAYSNGFVKNAVAVWIQKRPDGIFQQVEGEPESPL